LYRLYSGNDPAHQKHTVRLPSVYHIVTDSVDRLCHVLALLILLRDLLDLQVCQKYHH
jgi:hypothetical protein